MSIKGKVFGCLVTVFVSSCGLQNSKNYLYEDSDTLCVNFHKSGVHDGADVFSIQKWSGSGDELINFNFSIKGKLNKDSVDVAAYNYRKHGILPTESDLR